MKTRNRIKKLNKVTSTHDKITHNLGDIVRDCDVKLFNHEYKKNGCYNVIGEIDMFLYNAKKKIGYIFETKSNYSEKNYEKAKEQLKRAVNVFIPKYFDKPVKKVYTYFVCGDNRDKKIKPHVSLVHSYKSNDFKNYILQH